MELREALKGLPVQVDPNLLVGHAGADDAGVYRLDDERALVLTVDFFTPVVDDPYDYGRVAAANSLSDVYAMGGKAVVALNIAGFPEGKLPAEVLGKILEGGAAVAKEAGIVIVGGHTVKDTEVKYGLSVVGMLDPDRIIENSGARAGDRLILTKALGTGVLSTAVKADDITAEEYNGLIESMAQLNRAASEAMLQFDVGGCTDITGNGLLGHAYEMAKASGVTIEIDSAACPVLPGAERCVEKRYLTGGAMTNRDYVADIFDWENPDEMREHLLFDPQTSGGLLIAVAEPDADALLASLTGTYPHAAIVGAVSAGGPALHVK